MRKYKLYIKIGKKWIKINTLRAFNYQDALFKCTKFISENMDVNSIEIKIVEVEL